MSWHSCLKVVLHNLGSKEPVDLQIITEDNVNVISELGTTPLHFASLSSNDLLVKDLISKHADVTKFNQYGETPLHWACKNGIIEVVIVLLDNGANRLAIDADGNTPLHWAAEYANDCVLEYLLDLGLPSDMNIENHDNENLVETASFWGNASTVQYLLHRGADLGSGLLISMQHGFNDVTDVILEHIKLQRASPNTKKKSRTMLSQFKPESALSFQQMHSSAENLKLSKSMRKYSKVLSGITPEIKREARDDSSQKVKKKKNRLAPIARRGSM